MARFVFRMGVAPFVFTRDWRHSSSRGTVTIFRCRGNRAVRLQVGNNYDPVGDESPEVRETLARQRTALENGLDHFYRQWVAEGPD